ncbi:DHH family phosphoesterase [Rhodanobacter denitrificans]|uniref:single-stranded-DNA-specific exonuclease RecJ n=1 Tax=Rhodanobacter TaxID=75309 RepID=UPI000686399F|nr:MULTISPECIES: DHH family phosphoesterase [Rhodanobacter]UJM89032.1 DHH family phosphoesterase [Rhodanobacter denitrificans]
MDTPDALPDIERAADCIADAVVQRRPIAIVTDHDADGATSHAIIRLSLLAWGVPLEQISGFISHRMREGYGVTHAFLERILPELGPRTCVITADQGSADEARIARLREAGHCVVVTDHHGVPEEGPPPSAHAVVNPVRRDSQFPDQAIAGCHTALLVMAAVRDQLIARGLLGVTATRVSDFLDLCAVGTIADAVSLGLSHNNRVIIQRGLQLMNGQPRPCWRAMRRVLEKQGEWTVSDIAFQVATRINARGRLGDAMLSVEFLTASDEKFAYEIALELDSNNRERRSVERANTQIATREAQQAVAQGRYGLCLWLGEEGHAGVHGISATRMVERFGRPTICLSPAPGTPEFVTGSIRSTERVHVRNTLSTIQAKYPGLLISGGGHAGAGGLRVRRDQVPRLVDAWDECVRNCYENAPSPQVLVDGDLDWPTMETVEQIRALEPFGRGFEPPVFFGEWCIHTVRGIGDGTHIKLTLSRGQRFVDAIWFGAKDADAPLPVAVGQSLRAAYVVETNVYRGMSRLQLQIKAVEGVIAVRREKSGLD